MTIDPIERHLFLEGVVLRYGYDFRHYAEASLDRRLEFVLDKTLKTSLLDVLKMCLESQQIFRQVLSYMTINTTEFFRDPQFFRALRESVFPLLKTHAKVVIWAAGCSTGEEVLSLAIALREEGLDARSTIYATDINPNVLATAKGGIYDARSISDFNKNYVASAGRERPSDYYTSEYGLVRFDRSLFENIAFLEHNLVTDEVFVEAHLILCRNVLIYFSKDLQDRVLSLFARSLGFKGILGLGPKESLAFSSAGRFFETLGVGQNIFVQKTKPVRNVSL
jgi:chemotaxis protein methyltransferase CheR